MDGQACGDSEEAGRDDAGVSPGAAAALDCELVYGLTPREGTLEELAAAQKASHEKAREDSHEKRRAEAKATEEKVLKQIGWRRAFLKDLRRGLRKAGMKVR